MKLQIADNLTFDFSKKPIKTEGLRLFIAGISGAGKSYTLNKVLEVAALNGMQFVMLDPHGESHVLADPILGDNIIVTGPKVGVPVHIDAIPVYVELLKTGKSLVLDLKDLFFMDEELFAEFCEAFLREFLRVWSNVETPILVAIDEAHAVAPQSKDKGSLKRVQLARKLVRAGRKFGAFPVLATQSPVAIDKEVIRQSNFLLVGKLEHDLDWKAFTSKIGKNVSFEDIQGFDSGEFVAVSEGRPKRVMIHKRVTADAGATPGIIPKLSTSQKVDMKELAEKIQEAIKDTSSRRDDLSEAQERIKSLERSVESHKKEKQDIKQQLDLVEIVAKKFDKSSSGPGVSTTDSETIADIRAEFDKELSKLRKMHTQSIKERDDVITELKLQKEEAVIMNHRSDKFFKLFGELAGVTVGNNGVDIDSIVEKVAARVGNGTQVYEVAPLEALKHSESKRILALMLSKLDSISPGGKSLLAYLLTCNGFQGMKKTSQNVFGAPSGSVYSSKFQPSLKELKGLDIVEVAERQGVKESLDAFIAVYMENHSEDLSALRDHVIAHVNSHVNGGGTTE